MTIPIKIQCGCGQRYAFDVEATGDLMPNTVACPVCGADGTATANAAIAESLSAQPTVAAAPAGGTRIRVATPPPSVPPAAGPQRAARRAGQIDPTQAQHEAKAKIFWGDPPEQVIGYLLMQGFSHEEASGLVHEMFRERAATVRANGLKKNPDWHRADGRPHRGFDHLPQHRSHPPENFCGHDHGWFMGDLDACERHHHVPGSEIRTGRSR